LHNWTWTSNIKIISLNLLYVPIFFLMLSIINTRCRKIYLYKTKNYNILFSIYLLYASLVVRVAGPAPAASRSQGARSAIWAIPGYTRHLLLTIIAS
jgi:hypothetical protein